MSPHLLDSKVQEFILQNADADVSALALQKNPFPEIPWSLLLEQIAARQKAKAKLPTWYRSENIIYPPKISIEQTSSETAAQYKASLISGDRLIDLTGGFGIDDFYFAKQVSEVAHCEMNLELSAIAQHNFGVLGAKNISCMPGDSTEILQIQNRQWDWIYIDPSRRSNVKGKVFLLADCTPNVPQLLDFYFRYSHNILVKTAPLLDIAAGLVELHHVKAIHIVAVNGEVKELLWILEKGFTGAPLLEAVNLTKNGEETYVSHPGDDESTSFQMPQNYLYEPNSAVMKCGTFNRIANHFCISKLHRNTHLYTSDKVIEFPGRTFRINSVLPYNKAAMKQMEGKRLNISTRNFPLSVDELRKKWKLKDGGEEYAFFVTDMQNEKIVLLCAKI